jgi:hypothetical protein
MADQIIVQSDNRNVYIQETTPASPLPYLAMVSQSYYRPQGNYGSVNTVVTAVQYFTLLYVPYRTTLDRIGMRTSATSYSGTGISRLGIYANNNGLPSTLIADYGTITSTAASTNYEININETLNAGLYWLSFAQQTAPTSGGWLGVLTAAAQQNYQGLPVSLTSAQSALTGYQQSGITTAFANVTGVLTQSTSSPAPFVRAL